MIPPLETSQESRERSALDESACFAQSTLDALSAQICVLDERGAILTTNRAWREFARANPPLAQRADVGANYLQVCDAATGGEAADARAAAAGIRAVLGGERAEFTLDYPCHSPSERRWFVARVTRFSGEGPMRVVVAHENITARVLAEEGVRENEERFRSYFELGLVGMAITSPVKGWVEVNDELCRIFGYERRELVAMTWPELTYPDDLAADVAFFDRVVAGEIDGYSMEKRFIRKDGTIIDATISVKCLRHADRSINYFVAFLQDITDRKRAERALRESEARTRMLVKAGNIGLWDVNMVTNEVSYSPEWKSQIGYAEDEIPGHHEEWLSRLHPDDRGKTLRVAQEFSDGLRQIYEVEFRLRHKDGTWRSILSRGDLVRDEGGNPAFMLGCHVDLTDRKLAEEALRESELRFRQLAENIDKVFWLLNVQTNRVEYVSPAYEKIWGRSCASLYAEPKSWMDAIHPEDRARVATVDWKTPGGHDDTYRIVRADDSVRWIRDRAFPVRDEEGNLVRVAGIAEDITERRRAEVQIEHFAELFQSLSHRLLDVQEEERRHLARELHDEIGQALTAIKINLKIVAPEVGAAATGRLDDSVQILDQLLAQVRRLSLELRPPLLDELGLVPALRWLTDQQSQRAQLGISFSTNMERFEIAPNVRIACFRIAQEAITNTIRYARATTAAVELRGEADRLWLTVRDDGIGFDSDAVKQRAGKLSSAGLLSMVERASLLGGHLEITSAPGRGTKIHAWFPLAPTTATVPNPSR